MNFASSTPGYLSDFFKISGWTVKHKGKILVSRERSVARASETKEREREQLKKAACIHFSVCSLHPANQHACQVFEKLLVELTAPVVRMLPAACLCLVTRTYDADIPPWHANTCGPQAFINKFWTYGQVTTAAMRGG